MKRLSISVLIPAAVTGEQYGLLTAGGATSCGLLGLRSPGVVGFWSPAQADKNSATAATNVSEMRRIDAPRMLPTDNSRLKIGSSGDGWPLEVGAMSRFVTAFASVD